MTEQSAESTRLARAEALERQIYELTGQLFELRKDLPGREVADYRFETLDGTVSLCDLFAGWDKLLAIHNMGQGCRYCTLWADGINAFLPHLESELSVVLLSRDAADAQRRLANARGWRFRMASHGGGDYIREQTVLEGEHNMPGVVCYRQRDGVVTRHGSSVFGEGDLYCSLWHLLGVAGIGPADFTPQFGYWKRPPRLDDGGADVRG